MAESQPQPQPQRRVAMDPPHITEFASDRYFEKLNQLHASRQQADHAESSVTTTTTTTTTASRFILPLRESSKPTDEALKPADSKRDKGRFFSIRSKISSSTKHSKTDAEHTATTLPTRASTESTRKSIPFDQLFIALPSELQLQIVSSLPLTDILNLRLASKSWHALITANETPIVRHHLYNHIPAYALRLYPVPDNSAEINFHYLCSLWHRLHVAAKLSFLMCEWITKDIFLRQTEAQKLAFAPQHERMRRRLIPLLFTVFHFFETYRKLHLQYVAEHGHGLLKEPYTVNPIEEQIMNMYDNRTLLRVHEVFPLIISSFCRRLRPPTYVGRVERSLRGYLRERPPDEVHVAILCLGGLRQVERLWETKGYNNRRTAVDVWFNSLTKEPAGEASVKSRLGGLKGFGRKKSTSSDRPQHRTSFSEAGRRSPWGSVDSTHTGGFIPYSVFDTSLSADAPMAPLESDQAKTLLGDLPSLQAIWLTTAEAMIMDRKIVQRPQDIKRNQQVMLDLIQEDGLEQEDEWCYGRHISDSVRPPAAALGDDAD